MTASDVAALLVAVDSSPRPVRARWLAHTFDLPSAEVRAVLYQLQRCGFVRSHARRWTTNSTPTQGGI